MDLVQLAGPGRPVRCEAARPLVATLEAPAGRIDPSANHDLQKVSQLIGTDSKIARELRARRSTGKSGSKRG